MTTCVIPTKNEADTIGPLVEYLTFWGDVVVSDESDPFEGTDHAARKAGAGLVYPLAGGGLGGAYKEAWNSIAPDESVVHVDAGDSHMHRDIQRVIDLTDMGRWDVVIGSRFTVGGEHNAGWFHRRTSRLAAQISNLLSPYHVTDWTSGLRGYSPKARQAIEAHDFACVGHAWQIEALYVCLKAGCMVREVPITYAPSASQRGIRRTLEALRAWRVMLSW